MRLSPQFYSRLGLAFCLVMVCVMVWLGLFFLPINPGVGWSVLVGSALYCTLLGMGWSKGDLQS